MSDKISWIAVDWGSTHLRAYALGENNQLLHERTSDKGMGGLAPEAFESALLVLITDWLPTTQPADGNGHKPVDIVACGMVGARQGWQEAPYQQAPCYPTSVDNMIDVKTQDQRIAVKILPGVSQANPADIMRGEETQIAGLLAALTLENSSDNQAITTVCLPGTHSKWVALSEGKIDHFASFMTGEIFSLLSEKSMLRHTVGSEDWDNAAFIAGVKSSVHNPENLLSNCFRLRARDLLEGLSASIARATLSGLIIGAELAGSKPFWSGQTVALIGEPKLSQLYAEALDSLGVTSEVFDPKRLILLGLTTAYQSLSS